MTTAEKVAAFCAEKGLFAGGGRVLACVSGGADSVCLLALLRELRGQFGFTLSACHFNHHLRGAESEEDERFVRELCETWGIPLAVGGADVAAEA
ncbi:MAG: ATP-binding protein, partial [bacterium]